MRAYLLIGNRAILATEAAAAPTLDGDVIRVPMRLVDPNVVDRTTGAVRDVAAFVDLGPETLSRFLAAVQPGIGEARPVAAVLAHRASRRAVAVGPFVDAAAARRWWRAPRNRLSGNAAMSMVVVPLLGVASNAEEGGP
ncbi:hypothetical protein [Micromonospora aurantiaca (nom. illeg.)]|uniref:hypothetical protein n=1 Tax=Micromonospora aurantiaca (nom. illeg.) TaxID=47850 RepID=UPI0037BB1FD7